MKHIVFLAGSYYPDFSAVGYCANQVQKCLTDEFDITVVSLRNDVAQPLEETFDGARIQRIETALMKRRNALKKGSGPLARARLQLWRVVGAARRLLGPETIDHELVRAYLDRLNNMEPRPYAIIPLVFPFETALAALAYKKSNPEVEVYPYLFDDFVESGSLHILKIARSLKRQRHLRLERGMLECSDVIMCMHPLRPHFEQNFEKTLVDKITFLEHPLLVGPPEPERLHNQDVVRLCFTGSLIKKVREPDYLLDLLRAIRTEAVIQVDFFVMGNDSKKVRTEAIGDAVKIVNHGRVPKSQADAAVRNAEILINLGEARGKQVSSKIFEYMATGKPIVHLAYVKDDAVTKILKRYPLAICFEQDRYHLHEKARILTEFIDNHRSNRLSFDEVEKLYPEALPSTTAAVLTGLINSNRKAKWHKNNPPESERSGRSSPS